MVLFQTEKKVRLTTSKLSHNSSIHISICGEIFSAVFSVGKCNFWSMRTKKTKYKNCNAFKRKRKMFIGTISCTLLYNDCVLFIFQLFPSSFVSHVIANIELNTHTRHWHWQQTRECMHTKQLMNNNNNECKKKPFLLCKKSNQIFC